MGINKIIYGGNTLIDLTADTVTTATLLSGATAHDKTGATITGECDYDANTQDATATVDEVLYGETFYAQGVEKTGNMPNRGGVTGTITTTGDQYTIQQGYHDGSGKVGIDSTEVAKIIATNIKKDIVILGVTGSYAGESVTAEAKTVTPTTTSQTVLPTGADYLSQVTCLPIPYVESSNSYGTTVTIG